MVLRIMTLLCCITFSIMVSAQASGGQIKRSNRVQHNEKRNRSHNITSNKNDNHESVDLGLSVKWAKCNIGASKPHEYGSYFAWGETKPKSDYSWKTYFDLVGGSSNPHLLDSNYSLKKDDFIKYTRYNNLKFDRDCDAATKTWGGSWRTPSHDDFNELWSLPHEWVCISGVYGMRFTAKNGNSIFLPAAGAKIDDKTYKVQEAAAYWIDELHNDDYDVSELAQYWHMTKEEGGRAVALRYFGFSIRPVKK